MLTFPARPCCQKWWWAGVVVLSSMLHAGQAAKELLPAQDAANNTLYTMDDTNETDNSSATEETTTTTSEWNMSNSTTTSSCNMSNATTTFTTTTSETTSTNTSTTTTSTTTNTSTTTTTTSWNVSTCPPGRHLGPNANGEWVCKSCPNDFFKEGTALGPCQACPLGSLTLHTEAKSIDACLCNDTSWKNTTKRRNVSEISCIECPPNSVAGLYADSVHWCSCKPGYIREPRQGPLDYCREPFPCDVVSRLQSLNLTGPGENELHLGTCGNLTWLEHLHECSLTCSPGTAPQARHNILEAIDVSVLCEDGQVTKYPAVGTWCSREAYLMPPLVFLGTVAFAGLLAGAFIERRQHRWAEECTEALRFRFARSPSQTMNDRTSVRTNMSMASFSSRAPPDD